MLPYWSLNKYILIQTGVKNWRTNCNLLKCLYSITIVGVRIVVSIIYRQFICFFLFSHKNSLSQNREQQDVFSTGSKGNKDVSMGVFKTSWKCVIYGQAQEVCKMFCSSLINCLKTSAGRLENMGAARRPQHWSSERL